MRKIYLLLACIIGVCSAAMAQDAIRYTGEIEVDMSGLGAEVEHLDNQTISIVMNQTDKCTLSLYNFMFLGNDVGDIIINDVAATPRENGGVDYRSGIEDLTLADGTIQAKVQCSGVEDAEGNIAMDIDVTWITIKIPVTFKGKRVGAGVSDSSVGTAPAVYYRLDGTRVGEAEATGGIYIKRRGNTTTKVLKR